MSIETKTLCLRHVTCFQYMWALAGRITEEASFKFFPLTFPSHLETATETFVGKTVCSRKPVTCEVPHASNHIFHNLCVWSLQFSDAFDFKQDTSGWMLSLNCSESSLCMGYFCCLLAHCSQPWGSSDKNTGRDGAQVMPEMYFRWLSQQRTHA